MATEVKLVENTVKELLGMGDIDRAVNALIASGHGYHATIGALSTGIAGGGAGTILDQDQPEGIVSVGSSHAMIPVRIHIQGETPAYTTDNDEIEILIAADRAAAYAGDGTVTRESVFNMRTDLANSVSAPVGIYSAATGNITNPTLGMELARKIKVLDLASAVDQHYEDLDLLYEPKHPPIFVGPAAVYLYWGGTVAVNGYAQLQVVSFPASWVTNLSV
jgi:hypothetical protein